MFFSWRFQNSTGFYECTGRNPRIWGENGDCAWTVGFIYGAIFSVLLFSVLFCALCCFCYSTIFGHKNFQPRFYVLFFLFAEIRKKRLIKVTNLVYSIKYLFFFFTILLIKKLFFLFCRHCTRSYSLEDLKISGVNESLETKGSEPPS